MIRENSIVVMGAHDDRPDYDYADNAKVRIYALQEGQKASAIVYDMDQNADLTVSANGGTVTVDGNDTIVPPFNITAP